MLKLKLSLLSLTLLTMIPAAHADPTIRVTKAKIERMMANKWMILGQVGGPSLLPDGGTVEFRYSLPSETLTLIVRRSTHPQITINNGTYSLSKQTADVGYSGSYTLRVGKPQESLQGFQYVDLITPSEQASNDTIIDRVMIEYDVP